MPTGFYIRAPKIRIKKICLICNKEFLIYNYRKNNAKFCSYSCFYKSRKGCITWMKTNRHTKKSIIKMSKSWFKKGQTIGKNNINWKGDNAGKMAIHLWLRRQLGVPTKCEHCGKDGLTGKKIHWANKGHTYKRNTKDWLRLCVKCHKEFDKK